MAAIDIGPGAIVRGNVNSPLYTEIDKANPAEATGTITSVELYAQTALTGCIVGTFYLTGTDKLKCRASAAIGNVPAGSKQTFSGLSIAVVAGDYIGIYAETGAEYQDNSGEEGFWYVSGQYIDPNDEATYSVQPTGAVSLYGTGVTSGQTISPSSIIQPVSYGTPTVQVGSGALVIQPSSIVQVIAIGTPALFYPQSISPSSIIVTIAYGTPSVFIVGQAGYIYPPSIVQPIVIGSPTILKYVWHVILDGQYFTATPETNRSFVIGRDAYGNPVWGEAQDATEIGLVGERLDFTQELAIPTTAQAADVASAILAKMRLMGKRGVILIPPNCGQELFDVVQISDAGANQAAVSFRVVGIRFEYNPKQARYQHKLILGAP